MKRHRRFGGAMTAVLLVACAGMGTAAQAGGPLTSVTSGKVVGTSTTTTSTSINGQTTTTTVTKPLYSKLNPYYRNIGTFWGNVNPFYRNIGTFWGDVSPFYRNIGTFWGDINPYYRNIGTFSTVAPYGNFGNLGTWWDSAGTRWAEIDGLWAAAGTDPIKLAQVATKLRDFNTESARFWGSTVQAKTGQSFDAGFSNAVFSRYGINLADPATLSRVAVNERGHLMMDWYDGLMRWSGVDIPDHWMKTANWTPRLTQVQGSGTNAVIGLVDMFVAGDADVRSKVVWQSSLSSPYSNGHGAAVASLMVSSHDGRNIMGVAPNARIAAHNPFDSTGSADWSNVRDGILFARGIDPNSGYARRDASTFASVINLSLGVPGWTLHPDWNNQIFTTNTLDGKGIKIDQFKDKVVYVIAAGNDGSTQAQNIEWKSAAASSFLVVGSVRPDGQISDFSNRPGNACLLIDGRCVNTAKFGDPGFQTNNGGYLMNRFLVAPGELMLVSDDNGGITRLSGTSFAAPLVSGAIALLHDRWPWLKSQAATTAYIILKSAKDIGAPGVDPVYGVGLLDIEASQSPLDFNSMVYELYQGTTKIGNTLNATTIRNGGGVQSAWVTGGMHFVAFETLLGGRRDFNIPLSSRLWGTQYNGEYMQDFVHKRFHAVFGGARGLTDAPQGVAVETPSGWTMKFGAGTPAQAEARRERSGLAVGTEMRVEAPGGRFGFSVGHGAGAQGVGGQAGFAMSSDHDPDNGGVNPVLGFASGGAYAAMDVKLGDELGATMGFTQRRRSRAADMIFARDNGMVQLPAGLERYEAMAGNVRLDYRASPELALSASFTALGENTGLLGVRSAEATDLGEGTSTTAVTLGAELGVGEGVTLLASATGARTTGSQDNALSVSGGGLLGSSFQLGVAKRGLLGSRDQVRLSLAQPLTVEDGQVEFRSIGVIDRETGETGEFLQTAEAGRGRRFVGEALYATPLLDGRGELNAFGRSELGAAAGEELGWAAGASLRVGF